MVLWLWLVALAFGQATVTDRPVVPSAGLAAEGGPGTLWVNPANLAYDPDARFGVFFGQDVTTAERTAFAATWGMGALQVGAYNVQQGEHAAWSLDLGAGIPLPQRLAVGIRLDWHLLEGRRNYVGWDLGASWRPLPWFGLSAVARNIANPSLDAVARSGLGLAVRPFGDSLVLGLDYLRAFPVSGIDLPPEIPHEVFRATARFRPVHGLYLRAGIDSQRTIGAGVEVYFGGYGGGIAATRTSGDLWGVDAWIGTDEPGESLVRSGRRVPSLDLRTLPPVQPQQPLIGRTKPGWLDILELLRRLQDDRGVRGVVLTLGAGEGSWARYEELHARIAALEQAGKKVVIYLDGDPSPSAYYAASAASGIILHPAANLELTGPSAELVYYGAALKLLGVEAQVARRSRYKTAAEPLTDPEPSPEQLEQMKALIHDVHETLVKAIAAGRGVDEATARKWVEQGPWTGEQALDMGLIDARAYPDQLDEQLADVFGYEPLVTRLDHTPQPQSAWEAPSRIAVIDVEHAIVRGDSSSGRPRPFTVPATGSDTIVSLLDKARQDPSVKAVVLRVDSPGGSAFAADEIWRAVSRVQQSGKPVVASFGGTAASGGYYIAAGADAIVAEPTTITGSIGVIVSKVSLGPAMQRLGITETTVSDIRFPKLESHVIPWDPVAKAKVQQQVDATYEGFVDRVARGRKMTHDQVDAVAGGRVWSGTRAHEIGLVDQLGGFDDAVAEARRLAGIKPGRKVAVVNLTAQGLSIQSLSPALLFSPVPRLAAGWHHRSTPALPPAIQAVWQPLGTWARLSGQGILLIDPMLTQVQTQ